ncbi:transcriptional activator [Alteromonas phage vB_AcoS-R7M]|uniref:Transcriptional activator n=1 Tax=Alteromonas phage vB_AcoS-R7M TaxID=2729541 RepID=A0A6M3YRA9_9CAUD|nr:transcriptional activator [Alteromonas phage vB_AcoS-R7M]QJI53374.1 transcriptional activator [Alteromonas phage vB_AcoS-R7M]
MKTYSNKPNARRAARKVFENDNQFELVENAEGRWMFHETAESNDAKNEAFNAEVVAEYKAMEEIPSDVEGTREVEVKQPAKVEEVKTAGKGLKIEKDREERNGIKRPSVGGKCRAVWDLCDAIYNDTGIIPVPSVIKEEAAHKGLNANNAVIEMYQWRKFMGFVGRK